MRNVLDAASTSDQMDVSPRKKPPFSPRKGTRAASPDDSDEETFGAVNRPLGMAPKFAYISTTGASIGAFVNFSASAYGSSNATANYLVKALDAENPALVTLAISPGWVATDMGNAGAVAHGLPQAPLSVEDSVAGILVRVDAATKETSGRFWDYKAGTGGDSGEILW
ncbi:hypothetical protein DFH08DRAFT_1035104 [Mycena albidolilacea]|uniref:Uncharacterized protein n=1 Tax=Mycena albidolilacea TaxID=1033008 RepID=A0AAD6ZEL3_9AGAR|nr:hypothetical protein DFH08DRAFT_1035104 [Mycena albidolilacea]